MLEQSAFAAGRLKENPGWPSFSITSLSCSGVSPTNRKNSTATAAISRLVSRTSRAIWKMVCRAGSMPAAASSTTTTGRRSR